MWVPTGVASFACWVVEPRNRTGKGPGHDLRRAPPCAGGGRPQGSPLRCGRCGRRVWGRVSITFPDSPGNHAGGHTGGGGPGNIRGPGTVGASLVGAHRGRNVRLLGGGAAQPGRQGARAQPAEGDAVCRGGRPQGSPLRCGHRGRRVWRRVSIIFSNSPGNHAGGHRWGRTTWKRRPTGDRRGAPCGRPPVVVCDAVCRGRRQQGSPLRCGRCGQRVWGRVSIIFPDSPGSRAGGHRWGRTWKRRPTGDRRGAPCGRPPGSQRSPAGRWRRPTGSARGPVTTRGGRRRAEGRGTTRAAPTIQVRPRTSCLGRRERWIDREMSNRRYDPKIHHRRSIRLKGYDYILENPENWPNDPENPMTAGRRHGGTGRGAPCGRPDRA